ncbi:putative endoplasmic reticulum membrane protein [Smittium mucronatum]|uniref:Putative endoplasmic reticulum membrane protein n=1 Tax=Smittium mucronatum TaxID=133383 RepID=A0A1R0H1Z0_9FUNG|nr:putative endoplasmic reticulum membrane protein [Smittium mucronatum]
MAESSVFDLKAQYAQYGEYHSNPVNIVSHQIFVPSILWSSFGFLYLTGPLFPTPVAVHNFFASTFGLDVTMNAGVIALVLYAGYYFMLDPIAAFLFLPIEVTLFATSNYVMSTSPNGLAIVAAVYVTSWVVQVAGHYVFEKRAPALLDNLLQAFAMAPFFVFLELLFMLGYRPELQKEVHAQVTQRVQAFRAKQKLQ